MYIFNSLLYKLAKSVISCVAHGFSLQLLGGVAEPSMVCALLRHIDGLWCYYLCFPKLSRLMERRLVRIWGAGSDEARVLAFLILRRIVISSSTAKQDRMKKLLKVSCTIGYCL